MKRKGKNTLTKKLCSILLCTALGLSPTASISAAPADSTSFKVCHLQTNYITNPIGVDDKNPVFSWNMESSVRGQRQTSYQIMVSSTLEKLQAGNYDMWDSGKVAADSSLGIAYSGKELVAKERFFWQVRVWNANNETACSNELAFFETGLMDSGWGNAQFVGWEKKPSQETTFSIEMDFCIESLCAGIGFGTNTSNFYLFQINASTYSEVCLRPHKVERGGYSLMKNINIEAAIGYNKQNITGKLIHIKLMVEDGVVQVFFNHSEKEAAVIDLGTVVTPGKIIFRSFSNATEQEIASYDNIKICGKDGTVIFSEDFSNNSGSFNLNANAVIENGRLRVGSATAGHHFCDMKNAAATKTIDAAPMLRKEFTVHKPIAKARIYATSVGAHILHLNGNRVGEDYFSPGRTYFSKNTLYATYDVTDMLVPGENAIGAILGHGWYDRALGNFGNKLALMAGIYILYTDGSTEWIATDSSWEATSSGPYLQDDIFKGEHYDARRELDGWDLAGGHPSGDWDAAVTYTQSAVNIGSIVSSVSPAVRIVKTLTPVAVTQPEPNVYIYDFGQNFAGVVQVTALGQPGQVMTLRHGEALNTSDGTEKGGDGPEGTLYTANLISVADKVNKADSTDVYTFKGDAQGETYHPQLVYHGFRYVEITGLTEQLPLTAVKGLVMSSDLEYDSDFSCSNEEVNQLYSNTLWSQLSNFFSIPTDCPQRWERLGWTGDAQIFARTSTYYANTNAFYQKFLMDLFSLQRENGSLPTNNSGSVEEKASNGWADAGIIIPWQMYQQYGDLSAIYQYFDNMCKYVDHLVNTSNNYLRAIGPYGDWYHCGESTPLGIVDTAFSAYSANLLSKMAALIGQKDKAAHYLSVYENFKAAWRRNFVNSDLTLKGATQTAYVLGICFDLFEQEEKPTAAKHLVKRIVDSDYHMKGGFLGLAFLNQALSDTGYDDIAYKLLEQNNYPGWLYPITQGATTIWERLNAYTPETGFSGLSFNHFTYGTVMEWVYRYMLGIERDESSTSAVAYKHFILKPSFGGTITQASGSFRSSYGKIYSGWSRSSNGSYIYQATVPANTTATIRLPVSSGQKITEGNVLAQNAVGVEYLGTENGTAVFLVQSGSYTFKVSSQPTIPDIDGNGVADLKDAALLAQHVAGWDGLNLMPDALDVNADGEISLRDVVLVVRYVLNGDVAIYSNNSLASRKSTLFAQN